MPAVVHRRRRASTGFLPAGRHVSTGNPEGDPLDAHRTVSGGWGPISDTPPRPDEPSRLRVPPHHLEAEQSLLGAMLLSEHAVSAAATIVGADDFYKPAHRHIFDAIQALYASGRGVDPLTVAEELDRVGVLESVGGGATLLTLQANTPAITNAEHYARIVEEKALLRRLITAANDVAELGYSPLDLQPHFDVEGACREIGKIARGEGIELTVHPGQFVCMGSPNPKVVDLSRRCLEYHGDMSELFGFPGWKTVFHVGGTYGDKAGTLERLTANLALLSTRAAAGLVIENDDKVSGYSVRDLVGWGRLPVVLDIHHHLIHPDGIDVVEAAELAFSTWGDRIPKIHISEPCPQKGGNCRDHAEMPSMPPPVLRGTYDAVMEYKGKEDALIRMRELLAPNL